ncbi:MAG: hypothetical protein WBO58_06775 [Gammaproteobacteria bacterium]
MQNIIGQWLLSLKHYILMCLLLSSPERLPYSAHSIALTIFSYLLIGLLLVDEQRSYAVVCAQLALELGMLGLIAYTGLRWKKLLARFQQTFSALLGTNMIITAAMIPVYRSVLNHTDNMENLLIYLTLVIMIWNLAVLSLIFKRSFEISTHLSAMISFNYFVVYQFIIIWFF